MTAAALCTYARDQMRLVGDDTDIMLALKGGWPAHNGRRLCGPRSPRGEVIGGSKSMVLVLFSAREVLHYAQTTWRDDALLPIARAPTGSS